MQCAPIPHVLDSILVLGENNFVLLVVLLWIILPNIHKCVHPDLQYQLSVPLFKKVCNFSCCFIIDNLLGNAFDSTVEAKEESEAVHMNYCLISCQLNGTTLCYNFFGNHGYHKSIYFWWNFMFTVFLLTTSEKFVIAIHIVRIINLHVILHCWYCYRIHGSCWFRFDSNSISNLFCIIWNI